MSKAKIQEEAASAISALTGPASMVYVKLRERQCETEKQMRAFADRTEPARRRLETIARQIVRKAVRKVTPCYVEATIDCTELYDHTTHVPERRAHLRIRVGTGRISIETSSIPMTLAEIEKTADLMAQAIAVVAKP